MRYLQEALFEFCVEHRIWDNPSPGFEKTMQSGTKTIRLRSLISDDIQITSEADVDQLLNKMREKLKVQLLENTKIRLISR